MEILNEHISYTITFHISRINQISIYKTDLITLSQEKKYIYFSNLNLETIITYIGKCKIKNKNKKRLGDMKIRWRALKIY